MLTSPAIWQNLLRLNKRWANVPKPTVHKLIKSLLDEGMLDTVRAAPGRRPAILTFAELLNTLERKQLV